MSKCKKSILGKGEAGVGAGGGGSHNGTTHMKFDPTRVRTHDLQTMTVHFFVPEKPVLATRPSETVI